MISNEVKKKVIELYATGKHDIQDICKLVGISREIYYKWKQRDKRFVKELQAAEKHRLDNLKEIAVSGLTTLLQGKEWEETTTEGKLVKDKDGNEVFKTTKAKKVKKFILPNPATVVFTLKNLDSDNFADIFKQVVSTENKPDWMKDSIKPEEDENES